MTDTTNPGATPPAAAPPPRGSAAPPSPARGTLRSRVPTILMLLCLGAVGVWGHQTGWKAPGFGALTGRGAEAAPEDWCLAHGVPDSACIACHPELMGESPKGWCTEHGVPESHCTVCHPDLLRTGVAGDWCAEHGLPESGCTLCHPEIAVPGTLPADDTAATILEGSHAGEQAADHPHGPEPGSATALRDPATCQKHALKVQFASAASVEKAGVRLGQAVLRPMSDSVIANAEVDYDRTRFAKLAARAAGTAWRVDREAGAPVRTGDVLALLECPEAGRARAAYLQAEAAAAAAEAAARRMQASSEAGFRTEAERLAADAAAREAELRLFDARQTLSALGLEVPVEKGAAVAGTSAGAATARPASMEAIATLGLPASVVASLPPGHANANLVPLLAPFDGVVVSRDVVAGEAVDPGRTLFEVADTRRMRVGLDVPQSDAHRLAPGQEVIFRPDDARDEVVTGKVAWLSTAVDEMTRTVQVQAEVGNEGGALRAHSFGRAQVVVRTHADAVAVPSEAVQWEGCCYVVFVRLADGIFQTRKVRLGAKDAAFTEIVAGLLPGEVVATEGSHVLKSEILKSSLGAGCTDD